MSARLKADEISSIIKERIASYDLSVNVEETGKVISVADGVARVYGLKNVMAGEMVEFENGEKGLAQNLEESSVGGVGRGPEHIYLRSQQQCIGMIQPVVGLFTAVRRVYV